MRQNEDLADAIEKGLRDLRVSVEEHRDVEDEQQRFELFDQPLNTFEQSWLDRLESEELAELRGATVAAEVAAQEPFVRALDERDARDRERLPGMSREDQVATWEAENRSGEPREHERPEIQERAEAIYEQSRERVQNRYQLLRDAVQDGIREIEGGKESLQDRVQEARESLDAYRKLKREDPEAARLVAQNEQVERSRAAEQER